MEGDKYFHENNFLIHLGVFFDVCMGCRLFYRNVNQTKLKSDSLDPIGPNWTHWSLTISIKQNQILTEMIRALRVAPLLLHELPFTFLPHFQLTLSEPSLTSIPACLAACDPASPRCHWREEK